MFSKWPIIFFVNTIRQVIWPSPGSLGGGMQEEDRGGDLSGAGMIVTFLPQVAPK